MNKYVYASLCFVILSSCGAPRKEVGDLCVSISNNVLKQNIVSRGKLTFDGGEAIVFVPNDCPSSIVELDISNISKKNYDNLNKEMKNATPNYNLSPPYYINVVVAGDLKYIRNYGSLLSVREIIVY